MLQYVLLLAKAEKRRRHTGAECEDDPRAHGDQHEPNCPEDADDDGASQLSQHVVLYNLARTVDAVCKGKRQQKHVVDPPEEGMWAGPAPYNRVEAHVFDPNGKV